MAKGTLKSNKLIFLIIAVLMIFVFVGALTFLKNVYQTETYYVLNKDMATRSQVLPEYLTPVTTSKGTAPASLTPTDVQSGQVFTRYPVRAGETLTMSNTGGLDDISVGIPDSWVVTSFAVPADEAAAGRIRRGVYFDMMILTDNGAKYPFVNLLALDTSTSVSGASNPNAINTDEAHMGQSEYYYVGMSPGDAAYLQDLVSQYNGKIHLILAPRQNEYQAPDLAAYTGDGPGGAFHFNAETWDPRNMGEGTDNTFTNMERDEMGRPKNRDASGNVKYPVKCGNNISTTTDNSNKCDVIDNDTYSSTTTTGN